MNKCLYCGNPLKNPQTDFHPACSKEFFGVETPPKLEYRLDEMTALAKNIVEHSITVPGVQPKLSMGLLQEVIDGEDHFRMTVLDALGGNFILKPPSADYPQMPENEFLTMQMAALCGINVVPFSLIRLASGELAYITKRVDRTEDGQKKHQLDMFQITEAFDKYRSSMERVGKAVEAFSANTLLDLLRLFELTVFSFITGNNDMHLKNFSLLLEEEWSLSPAYDLLNVNLLLPEDKEELALTLNGKKSSLKKTDFECFGKRLQLNEKQIENTFKRFKQMEKRILHKIDQSFLTVKNKERYINLLVQRLSLF